MATELTIKRPVVLKVIVTPRWKEEVTQQLQTQATQLDQQLQDIDMQGQRAIAEVQKQGVALTNPQALQQIEAIQTQVNQKKNELQQRKNQLLQQLDQLDKVEMEQEVAQGQIDGTCTVAVGDNLVKKLQVEVVVRDGIVQEIRGEL
ncbi:YlqD family protein [Spirulina major CS-329]|uniref:YlqD family protein n=1 Tax=Spirulina TaxID=1154 RepID=UPI0023312705|nr:MULTISPECIES: YlqD family protein [Spirulina]MDB9494891.1 YlqD family protein [Spirulina subsalsa CS-330]MDB9504118.1 YlqD family protein [Spirulina major CS-329]